MEDRDLQYHGEIRDAFLQYVENLHADYGYERDFLVVAKKLGITVKAGNQNSYIKEHSLIIFDRNVPKSRLAFTLWHELSHHLFSKAMDGDVEAFLDNYTWNQQELRRAIEEEFCNAAASLLQMPKPVFNKVRKENGYSPVAVFELAEQTGASIQAALRRIVYAYTTDIHAVLVDAKTYKVLDSVAHGGKRKKYSIGSDFQLEKNHPLIVSKYPPKAPQYFEAFVPFKSGKRFWNSKVIAATDSNHKKILGFFLDSYPNYSCDPRQLSLWELE